LARPSQHHGVLQAVQRPHQGPRPGWAHHPVVISVYADRIFSFITKTPPAPVLLLKAARIEKGSGTPNKEKKGKVTEKQIIAIATQKMPDMNATTVEAAAKTIRGTARSMGIEVVA
jgi:large subunit ribosomal protein L11